MTEALADRLRAILEEYRDRVTGGGHPKELPDRILALVRESAAGAPMPEDLAPLHAAARHYWKFFDDLPEGEGEPDPIDLEMLSDELIDALYDFYGVD